MRELRLPSGHTVVTREGRDPGVLLLNGCGLAAAGWSRVVDALPGRRIIAVDRPGRRGTTLLGMPTLADETRFLRGLLEESVAAPVVVAHSMAAFQAEALARIAPRLVGGVVLVDPSVSAPARARARAVAEPLNRAAGGLLRWASLRRAASRVVRAGLRANTVRPEIIDTAPWRETWASGRSLAAAAAEWLSYSAQAVELQDLRAAQGAPAAVEAVVLQAPPPLDAAGTRALLASFRAARLRRVTSSRHLMMLDAPTVIAQEVDLMSRRGGLGGTET